MDRLTPAARSRHMSKIRSKNTTPELSLRKALHAAGFRYRLHRTDLAGTPDLVLAKYRAVIFVHGCFWHRHAGCRLAYSPKSRRQFWMQKFAGNIARDSAAIESLRLAGWRVLTVWECGLRSTIKAHKLIDQVTAWIRSNSRYRELPKIPPDTTTLGR